MIAFDQCCVELCNYFFDDPAPAVNYTLSLHDALPIWRGRSDAGRRRRATAWSPHAINLPRCKATSSLQVDGDRKSTRLNSSHGYISYAVFCLKKKKLAQAVQDPGVGHPSTAPVMKLLA